MKGTFVLLAILSIGCAGRSFNPKASVCMDPNFDSDQDQGFLDAAQEWHDKTNGDIDFKMKVGSGCELDLMASPHLRENDGPALGITDSYYNWIKFDVDDSWVNKKTGGISYISQFSLREVALHEFGHYLTGPGHSPNREDIMFAKGPKHIKDDGAVAEDRHLTEADVLRWTGTNNHSYNIESDPYPAEEN